LSWRSVSTRKLRWLEEIGDIALHGLTGGEVIPLDRWRRSGLQRPSRWGLGMTRLLEFVLQDGDAILVQADEAAADPVTRGLATRWLGSEQAQRRLEQAIARVSRPRA
jgi:hypothetical protein